MKIVVAIIFLLTAIFASGETLDNDGDQQACPAENFAPIIETESGKVRGLSIHDGQIHHYRGIRYARAKRFELPTEVEPWSDVYDATITRDSCPQMKILFKDGDPIHQSEDCLFLNVWRPANATNLPVMFWIYGGAFQAGSIFEPDFYNGEYLSLLGNVIVVSVNYRLGPFGFLYAGDNDKSVPGNQGFHDQIQGLRWVQKNIGHFGGDPGQVTIFGESAGSISVGTLVNSPLTDGLFHRAILQSGYIFRIPKEEALRRTKNFANKLGCTTDDDMIKCLRTKTVEEIIDAGSPNTTSLLNDGYLLPIDGDAVVPEDMSKISDIAKKINKKIDLIFGVCHDEGTMFLFGEMPQFADDHATFTLDEIKKIFIDFSKRYRFSDPEKLVDFYTGKMNISDINSIRTAASQFIGDWILTCPTMLYGKEMAKKFNAYAYELDTIVTLPPEFKWQPWQGVNHGADIPLVFGLPMKYPDVYKKSDELLSREIIQAWTQFAKTGKPGTMDQTEWIRALENSDNLRHLSIAKPYRMVDNGFVDNCENLWKSRIFH